MYTNPVLTYPTEKWELGELDMIYRGCIEKLSCRNTQKENHRI